jgi:hypothetical protein
MIDYFARDDDAKAAREIRLLLVANVTTSDTMYGVLGEYDSPRCNALRHAAGRLEYTAQWGHIRRAKPIRKRTKKRGAK